MRNLLFALFLFSTFISNAQLYCDSVLDFEPTMADTVCFNGPFTLDAAQNAYDDYLWQDGSTNSEFFVTGPGIYICQVTANTGNIVVNGDFEDGNNGTFYTDYTYDPTDVLNALPDHPTWVANNGMLDESLYAVGVNPNLYHTNWPSVIDHTTGSGNMLLVNGSSDTTINIWCQTIDVGANADYTFSAWVTSIFHLNPATFIFTINGDTIGDVLQHSGEVGDWNEFHVGWHSDAVQQIDICIQNQNSYLNGNDFAIDDIFFGAACVQADTIYVVENPTSVFSANDVCTVDTVEFLNSSIANSGTIINSSWTFGDGDVSSATNPAHFYDSQSTYQVGLEVTNSYGCIGNSSVSVSINPPPISNITTNNVLCYNGNDGNISVNGSGGQGPYSYNWSFGSTDPVINNLPIGIYNVTITDANGCTNTNSTEIFQPTQLVTSAAPINITCYNDQNGEINLDIYGGTPPYSYNWNNGAHSQDIDSLSPNSYFVTIIDNNGCTIQETGNITEPTQILIDPNSNFIQCHGDETGIVDISVIGGVTPYTYNWNNNTTTQDVINISAGSYTVTVTDNSGCTKIRIVEVVEPNPLVVSLPDNYTHCNNETNLLASVEGGTTPYSYSWNTGGTNQTNGYQTNNTAIYSVTVTDNHNCTAEDLIEITIIGVDIELSTDRDTVCPGDPIVVDADIIGGMPPYTVYNQGSEMSYPYIVYPNGHNNIVLQVIDACGNTANAPVDIYTHPVANLSFNADILRGCPPLTVNFNQHTFSHNSSYSWNFDDIDENNYSDAINPTHTFTESGFYDIEINTTDSNSCSNQLTIVDMIEVYPSPDAHFEPTPQVVSVVNSLIDFDNYSIQNFNNYWYFDDGNESSLINPHHRYETPGIYYPKLIVESDKGCLDTAIHKVEIKNEFTLFVPTAYSPDNDDINDGFRAVGNGIDLDNYFIAVYDRWGEQIWSSKDLYEYWKGNAHGKTKTVQIGVYTWIIICKDFNGVEHTKSGNVTVIK